MVIIASIFATVSTPFYSIIVVALLGPWLGKFPYGPTAGELILHWEDVLRKTLPEKKPYPVYQDMAKRSPQKETPPKPGVTMSHVGGMTRLIAVDGRGTDDLLPRFVRRPERHATPGFLTRCMHSLRVNRVRSGLHGPATPKPRSFTS